jgi:hypothetical protein
MFTLTILAVPESVEAERLPMPREVVPHIQVERLPAGYQVILSRKASETLHEALKRIGNGQPYSELVKLAVKELNEPEVEAKIEVLAFVIRTQAPALTKSLGEKMGEGGAIIKIFGIEKKLPPEPPPLAKAIADAFLPEDIKEKVQTGIKVVNTTPLYWRVEPRK